MAEQQEIQYVTLDQSPPNRTLRNNVELAFLEHIRLPDEMVRQIRGTDQTAATGALTELALWAFPEVAAAVERSVWRGTPHGGRKKILDAKYSNEEGDWFGYRVFMDAQKGWGSGNHLEAVLTNMYAFKTASEGGVSLRPENDERPKHEWLTLFNLVAYGGRLPFQKGQLPGDSDYVASVVRDPSSSPTHMVFSREEGEMIPVYCAPIVSAADRKAILAGGDELREYVAGHRGQLDAAMDALSKARIMERNYLASVAHQASMISRLGSVFGVDDGGPRPRNSGNADLERAREFVVNQYGMVQDMVTPLREAFPDGPLRHQASPFIIGKTGKN